MRSLLLVLLLAVAACQPFQALAVQTVDDAVERNNDLVLQLQAVHDEAKAQRRRVLLAIATSGVPVPEGEAAIRETARGYDAVFDAFQAADVAQAALAEVLEAAQAAVRASQTPDIDAVLRLAGELAQAHAAVMAALVEVR